MNQGNLFNTGYSYLTSLPAYKENSLGKGVQAERILSLVSLSNGITLLELSELSGLPQSTVSGRIGDLMELSKVRYDGLILYKGRNRKRIVVTSNSISTEIPFKINN